MKAKTKPPKKTELPGSRVKLRFKRHILPPLVGLAVALSVLGFFKSQLLTTRVVEHFKAQQPQTTTDAQTLTTPVSKDAPPRLIINSVNVNAPLIFETQNSAKAFSNDLQRGVVHYPDTALPGHEGNVVVFGHSGGQWWAPGNYKFVFTLLNRIEIGDQIFINYHGQRYIYKVYDETVASPSDLSVLNQSSSYTLTLITATPVGTNTNRLIIRAQQYLPVVHNDYASTKAATLPAGAKGRLPGNNSPFWYDLGQLL